MDLTDRLSSATFSPTRLGEGYDPAQVDEFLQGMAAEVGGPPSEWPTDLVTRLETARFPSVRMKPGYDMDEVDRFVDDLARELREGHGQGESAEPRPQRDPSAAEGLAELVANQRFRPMRAREGYEVDAVDDFLHRLAAELRTPVSEWPADIIDRIEAARFTPTRFQEAYSMDDVDDFLDRIVFSIRDALGLPQPAPPAPGQVAQDLRRRRPRLSRTGARYAAQDIDELVDAVVAALEAPGDDADRRARARDILDAARPADQSGLTKGYRKSDTDAVLTQAARDLARG